MREEKKSGPTGESGAAGANTENVEATANLVAQPEKSTPWPADWPELFRADLSRRGWRVGPIAANGGHVDIHDRVHHEPEGWACFHAGGLGVLWRKGDVQPSYWYAPCVDGAPLARVFFTFAAGRCSHVFDLLARFS